MLNCSVNQRVNTSVCYYTRSGRAHKTGRSSLCCFSILIGLSHYAAGTCAKPYHQFSKLPSWMHPAPPGPTTVPEITLITHVSVWFGMRFFCLFCHRTYRFLFQFAILFVYQYDSPFEHWGERKNTEILFTDIFCYVPLSHHWIHTAILFHRIHH